MGTDCTAAAEPGRHERRAGTGRDNRRFVEAVLWLLRNGCRWRALPAAWGNRHTTYTRFQRWTASGVWARVLAAVQQDDAPLACWWSRPPCGPTSTLLGRTKKRAASPGPPRLRPRACKLHAVTDARGRFVRGRLTAGQRHDAP